MKAPSSPRLRGNTHSVRPRRPPRIAHFPRCGRRRHGRCWLRDRRHQGGATERSRTRRSPMSRLSRHRHRFVVLLALLLGLAILGSAVPLVGAAAATGSGEGARPGPRLTNAAAAPADPGTVLVTGEGFTPGGRVYLALYDAWGVTPYPTGWLTASPTAYGQDGSRDPAAGFSSGGTIAVAVDRLCGADAL